MNTHKQFLQFVAIALIGGVLGGAVSAKLQSGNMTGGGSSTQVVQERHYVEESDSIKAIDTVVPTVISIVATKDLQVFQQNPLDPFGFFGIQQQPQQAQPQTRRQQVSGGTGFVVQEDGLAVTNKHVVIDPDADYTALTSEGKKFDVEVISRDPVNDLALVQLHESTETKPGEKKSFGDKPKNLPFARIGDSSKLKVGQRVLAIGNARGEYVNSVTSGILSAVGRQISAGDKGGVFRETLTGLLQTDAAINFGNSGGPLINLDGEVIGVNTAVDQSATSVGFAIPANQVTPAIESVKKFGKIVRPYLGVNHLLLTKERAKELKLEGVTYGALIVGDRMKKDFGVFEGSPAEKAGLRMDDVILEIDGEKVTEDNTLQSIIQKHSPNDTLKLKVWRNGSEIELKATLTERKE